MSVYSKRIQTLKALVTGSIISQDVMCNKILEEFNQVENVAKVSVKQRRLLLQLLHSTRALDSSLDVFTRSYNLKVGTRSLGGYLRALRDHTEPTLRTLSAREADRFHKTIVVKRNRYMHEAGAFPRIPTEIESIVGEMESCLSQVVALPN